MATLALLLGVAALEPAASAFSFVSLGDWGGAGISSRPDDYHRTNELEVARQLGQTAADLGAKFVINTGDNFYYCGVHSLTDEQWKVDFEDVFTHESLNVPWYGILGNHDYAYDVQSQFSYKSPNNDRWQLPSYYYTKRLQLGASQYVTFVFIDSSPCISSYRGDDPAGWDPCSGKYGECKDTPDGECHFHEHIVAQDCSAQLAWFQRTLESISDDDWVIAVGHHEADKIDVEDFTKVMLAGKVSLYLNGHTHALKHYRINSQADIDFFTTGAGCMVHTHDQDVCLGATCASNEDLERYKVDELFYQAISGFTAHTFSEDFSTLTTKVLDVSGNVLHSFVTAKRTRAANSTVALVV
mmetsp:Transcript_98032/g.247388  ORF Transcript_98032/g.247388 Transcript_98032/m.247388 type:complete len:356 (+) Transcript_98032:57-1124(+)